MTTLLNFCSHPIFSFCYTTHIYSHQPLTLNHAQKIAKILFWLVVAFLLLIQLISLFNEGANTSTLVVVSEILVFAFLGFVYLLRAPLSKLSKTISSHRTRFILIGYLATMFAETVYIFSHPIHRNLFWDLALTTPFYVLWMALWYRVLKKYRFSIKEAFYLGGLNGFFVEGVFTGFFFANPALGLLSPPS